MSSPSDKVIFFSKTILYVCIYYFITDENAPPPVKSADVRDYARQLSERKRLEDQKRKEDNFLRRSLRQSEKLRSLARAKKAARDLKAISASLSKDASDSIEGINLFPPSAFFLRIYL